MLENLCLSNLDPLDEVTLVNGVESKMMVGLGEIMNDSM